MFNFKIFIIFTFLFSISKAVKAADCLDDIVAAGTSFDSVLYSGQKNNSQANLASNLGYGFKSSWLIYCPQQNIEFGPYLRFRHFNFKDVGRVTQYQGVPNSINLLSVGVEAKFPFILRKELFELPIDLELREEMGFNTSGKILNKKDYLNLKLMGGIRKFLWIKENFDITGVLRAGILLGLSNGARVGFIYGMSFEFLRRISSTMSLKFDTYYDLYSQGLGDLDMLRREIGIRSNIILRL